MARLDDAGLAALRSALERRAPSGKPRRAGLAEAAVSVLLRTEADSESSLLLIRRATKEGDPWSGHTALPGGRRDAADASLLETARRETLEEVGLDPLADGELLGRLPDVAPSSRRLPPLCISPFVFAVRPREPLRLREAEVDAAVWVPLSALRDERSASEILIEIEGRRMSFPSLTYEDYVVWGLTLRVLHRFFEALDAAGGTD